MTLYRTVVSTVRTASDRRGPPRSTMAILAVLAAMVCVAATVEAAVTRPVDAGSPVASPREVAARYAGTTSSADASARSAPPWTSTGSSTASKRAPERRLTPAPATDPGLAAPVEPDLILAGSWTVEYVVGPANGNGANIEIPLRRLDGQIIKPGATFDFWTAVGEVSRRTGYRRGAIIVGHRIDSDGALAGGICTVSTALFNAAARAGLQIGARTSHSGYLAKYPLGLDAAVAKSDHFRQTMAFRNDTTETIVIRTVGTPGIARVDLYAKAALGRTAEFSRPAVSHRQKAHDRHVMTTAVPRGEYRRIEDGSDGMTVIVRRIVRDADGRVLHRDRWVSLYRRLDGLLLDGAG